MATSKSILGEAAREAVAWTALPELAWLLSYADNHPMFRTVTMALALPAAPGLMPGILLVGLGHSWRHQSGLEIVGHQLAIATPINLLFYFVLSYCYLWVRRWRQVKHAGGS